MTYAEKLRDPRWQKRRLEVLNKANWSCEDCYRKDQELQVHHCCYLRHKEPWDYPDGLLMCLCSECHPKRQDAEDGIRSALAYLFRVIPFKRLQSFALRLFAMAMEEKESDCVR